MRKLAVLAGLCIVLSGAAQGQDNNEVVLRFEGAGQTLETRPADYAEVQTGEADGRWVMLLDMTPDAADGLAVLTAAAIGQEVALVLCDIPILTVVVQAPISDGKALIPLPDEDSAVSAGEIVRGEVPCSALRMGERP